MFFFFKNLAYLFTTAGVRNPCNRDMKQALILTLCFLDPGLVMAMW